MRRALLTALLLLSACVPRAIVPDEDRRKVTSELEGQRRWLRVAAYASPFFSDRGKVLLSDQPGSELDLLETAQGEPIAPPAPERILPPGTWLRIDKIEFPTGWTIARRVVMTPRYHPWVYCSLARDERPYIIVLPQTVASYEDVRSELDRMLSADDPSPALAELPQPQRDAILKKEPAEGMSAQALEMAWGYPEKKKIDRPAGTEEWSWAGGKRRAVFQKERLVKWEPK